MSDSSKGSASYAVLAVVAVVALIAGIFLLSRSIETKPVEVAAPISQGGSVRGSAGAGTDPAAEPAPPAGEAGAAPAVSGTGGGAEGSGPASAGAGPARPAPRGQAAAAPARPGVRPPARPLPAPPTGPRRFSFTRTSVENTGDVKKELKQFETAGVEVKRAPEVMGNLEFLMVPPAPGPGEEYKVQIYLINEGEKGIKVSGVTYIETTDGKKRGGAAPKLSTKDVASHQRELLTEIPGTWKAGVKSWTLDVTATSSRGDVYKSQYAFK